MTYSQTIHYLFSLLPMFQRVGAAAYKPGLDNTLALANAMGNPQNKLTFIHVAGTNGKGSTSHMLASVFMEMGWKTGLYTSPHLKDFRERIKIDGKCISPNYVRQFVEEYKSVIEELKPSFFELTCIMAMKYFADKKVDMVILETGMGGRLDSTNIVLPELAVITNISKDHTQFLGNTLELIAGEKAGIIKPGIPVVLGESGNAKVLKVIQQKAKQNESPFFVADKVKIPSGIQPQLKGQHQKKNVRTVLKAVQVLNDSGYTIPAKTVQRALAKVVDNTGLMGRWQTLSKSPHVIADIGHNEAGIKEVIKNLKQEKYKTLHIVLGVVNDKDVSSMLAQLPKKARYYFTKARIPRALPAKELELQAKQFKLNGYSFLSVKTALNAAKKASAKGDLIFVGGSAFVVAEAL